MPDTIFGLTFRLAFMAIPKDRVHWAMIRLLGVGTGTVERVRKMWLAYSPRSPGPLMFLVG